MISTSRDPDLEDLEGGSLRFSPVMAVPSLGDSIPSPALTCSLHASLEKCSFSVAADRVLFFWACFGGIVPSVGALIAVKTFHIDDL